MNGGLGYGFSSITVPLALLFLSNRVLNPALVLIEVVLNAYVLFVNRDAIPAVWRRAVPIVLGLMPGVIAGTLIVSLGGYGPAATIVGLFFILGLAAAPFLPETNGKPLPGTLSAVVPMGPEERRQTV